MITGKRELEGGIKSVVRMRTPALVTCQLGLNVPRYPTLPNIMKAKKKEIEALSVSSILKKSRCRYRINSIPRSKEVVGLFLKGMWLTLAIN